MFHSATGSPVGPQPADAVPELRVPDEPHSGSQLRYRRAATTAVRHTVQRAASGLSGAARPVRGRLPAGGVHGPVPGGSVSAAGRHGAGRRAPVPGVPGAAGPVRQRRLELRQLQPSTGVSAARRGRHCTYRRTCHIGTLRYCIISIKAD